MNWQALDRTDVFNELIEESKRHPILLFKHSTRCSISAAALDRLERQWQEEEMQQVRAYFLDLIRYREVSDQVAEKLAVLHQSPQAILLKGGQVVYEASHFGIDYNDIKESAKQPAVSS